ncbi:MAG: uncharacterized SAM-binding protein YcdF (DUF218 family) [Candidatus Promineifilaceae bacterium]|jgi:uncharacterized SAM-binding protein YcdF (DUF218 family)
MRHNSKSRKRLIWRICLATVIGLLLSASWTAWRIWTFETTTTHNADAAIILGASTWNGVPSPVFKARIDHGIDLYHAGRVSTLLFSGGTGIGEPTSLAEAAHAYALQRGVPKDAIVIEPYSRITKENIVYSRQVAAAYGLTSFLIVSDPLHMKRAMRMARANDMRAWPSATPTTRYRSLKTRLWFLKRETYFYIQYVLVTRFIPPPPMPTQKEEE